MGLNTSEVKLTIYSPRNSVEVFDNAEALYEPAEVTYTPEQEEDISSFARAVYGGEYKDIKRESDRDLEEIQGLGSAAFVQNFYLGYFATAKGKEDKVKLGIKGRSTAKIEAGLIDIENVKEQVTPKERKAMAKRSLDWYKGQIVDALDLETDLDAAHIDDESASINYEPQKLIDKLNHIAQHRAFYRAVKADLKKDDDGRVKDAKMLELELEMAKANNMMADLYSSTLNLGQQLIASDQDEQTVKWLEELKKLTPVIYRAFTRHRKEDDRSIEDFQYSLALRTDHLDQGVAVDGSGNITPISGELVKFAADVVARKGAEQTPVRARVDEETVARLKETKWTGEQFKEFCEDILRGWGWLSEHQADVSEALERDGPAKDKKWQVIVDPQKDSIAVDRAKKLLKVPESFNRDLVKSLPIAAHELTHLVQAESSTVLAEKIPLAAARGRRTGNLAEGGAVDQETKVYRMLGVKRPTRIAYLRALEAKLAGANIVQVARAFYESYEDEETLGDEDRQENKALAADRSLRLYRNGGYNSQPLDYIEGELSRQALEDYSPETVEAIMLTGVSFSLRDSARLHRAGLYDPPQATDKHPAEEVWQVFNDKYLPAILTRAA